MMRRLLELVMRRFLGNRRSAWVLSSAAYGFLTFLGRRLGRRQLIDLSNTKPGDVIVIEHLHETHKEQLRGERAMSRKERKAARKAKAELRTARKEGRRQRRAERGLAREARRAARAARAANRRAKRQQRTLSRADRLQRRAEKIRDKVSE